MARNYFYGCTAMDFEDVCMNPAECNEMKKCKAMPPAPSGPFSERPCPACFRAGVADFEYDYDPNCKTCHGTGWIETEDGE